MVMLMQKTVPLYGTLMPAETDLTRRHQRLQNPTPNLFPRNIIVTTPNASYIPTIFLELLDVRAMRDGHFGAADFTLTPQIWAPECGHLAFVLKHPGSQLPDHPWMFFWYELSADDIETDNSRLEAPTVQLRQETAEMLHSGVARLRLEVEKAMEHHSNSKSI
ncbi:hypothetical protein C8J56DRAFT_1054229 [Mycena floridula]|nr:hypothetical protein C8J56DRAFT_1054229 [Mycena floridula]